MSEGLLQETGAPVKLTKVPPRFDDLSTTRPRVGLLALSNDIVIEEQFRTLVAKMDIGLYVSRVAMPDFGSVEALGSLRHHIADAVKILVPRNEIGVVAFGCTAASAIIGEDEISEIVTRSRGCPVSTTNPISAAVRRLRAIGAKRINLLTPYPEKIAFETIRFLQNAGIEVARTETFDTIGDENISRISPAAIKERAKKLLQEPCDALFISCTALRVVELISPLEAETGKPVVTSNQALLADALDLVGFVGSVNGFGRVLNAVGAR